MKTKSTKLTLAAVFYTLGLLTFLSFRVSAQTCQAGFTYSAGSNGVVYFFNTSTSTDSMTNFYWEFGNNQTGVNTNPIITYANAGVYNVCLVVGTLNQTCFDTICQQITVPNNCNLIASIASDSIAGTMTAITTGGVAPFSYQWSDGSTQQVINPVSIGSYCVTVTDAIGCTSYNCYFWNGTYCNYGYTFNYGTQGAVNFFTAGTNNQPVTWDFGDGTTQITTAATYFSHTYAQSGTYQVCITMAGCMPFCASVNVNIPMPCSGVTTDIVSVQNNTYLVAEVFNANYPVSYQWTTGDTGQSIATNGVSTYCVTITDALGCTATDCITVNPNCNMTIGFEIDTIAGTLQAVVINGAGNYSYMWNNGATQEVILPITSGTYCVTVTDGMGCSANNCYYWNGINCNYGYTYNTPNQGLATFYTAGANGQMVSWDFGDGSQIYSSTNPQTSHNYQSSGTYNVCMAIGTCPAFCSQVTINITNPCANFTAEILSYQSNLYLGAIATNGTGPYSYQWSTGDTAQGIATTLGNTTYCVTITDLSGCTATDCITIIPGCNLNAIILVDSIQGFMTANAGSGTAPFTYQWSNGSTQQTIIPGSAGSYCVTITDALGCSTTDCVTWSGIYCNNGFTYTYQGPGEIVLITYGNNGQSVTWDFGDGTPVQTSSASQLMHTYTIGGYYQVCMSLLGCNSVCMNVYVNVPGNSQICGNVFYDNNNNSVIDLGDTGIDSTYVYLWGGNISQSATTDAQGNYSFNNLNAGTYYLQFCTYNLVNAQGVAITVPVVDTAMCATYTVTIGANDTICGNNFGVYNDASEITGTVFLDANNNGVMDGTETGLSYQLVQIGNNYTYSDWYGNYSIWLTPGIYTVSFTPVWNYAAGTITTASSYQINVTAPGNYYGNNNFGVYMPPGMNDLSVVITPHTTVTPGFPAWYDINVCNYGSSATGATVTMIYDAVLTTNYQSPSGIVNSATHTITWNIANISPNSCTNIWTSFDALTSIQLGAGTLEFVMVTPTSGIDNYTANNTDTVHQTIIGSWDPNNKIVVKTNNSADPATHYISSANANQEIIYTINFQNTGNAPAVNVVVIDEMAAELEENSYQFLNASHNCDIHRIGNIVTYRFMNIMLPDSTNNEPNSHGFINFKINADNALAMGTQIIDFANIYFDFNNPVLTNDAVVTLIDVTGVSKQTLEAVNVYPNPAKESFNVTFNSNVSGNASIVLYDNTGRKVMHNQTPITKGENKTTINTMNLENGLYFIELLAPNGTMLINVISIQN